MSRSPVPNPGLGYGRPMPWVDFVGGPSLQELDGAKWHGRAACTDARPSDWFAHERSLLSLRATKVCDACPVRRACLASSLVYAEEYGIWGGLTPDQRMPLLSALAKGRPLGRVLDAVVGPLNEVA